MLEKFVPMVVCTGPGHRASKTSKGSLSKIWGSKIALARTVNAYRAPRLLGTPWMELRHCDVGIRYLNEIPQLDRGCAAVSFGQVGPISQVQHPGPRRTYHATVDIHLKAGDLGTTLPNVITMKRTLESVSF